ncbi:hypothetical protein LTR56_026879 [Elasticomyces elasticus]|nr:hypothetical protein LTR56_026879 [Elasticomyces elasticus]KAK4903780.1 hypothetical protein LTR49_026650 [Elasticomyces elasticus]KAK5737862.1 hypothetical protein LTS12_025765 [Elasticomyces elasticus]
MAHYQVKVPYRKDYWRNHFLCLWEVTPAEVVGIWDWDDLRKSPNLYGNVVVPAINQHRQHVESTISLRQDVRQNDLELSANVGDFDEDVQWGGSGNGYNSEVDDEVASGYGSDDSYERCARKTY